MFCIALGAHDLWLSRQAGVIWRWQRPMFARLLVILGLAVTPVISFYGSLIVQHAGKRPRPPLLESRWSLFMPLIGAAMIALCIVRTHQGYSPVGRTWSGTLSFAPGFVAFYLAVYIFLYMAAQLFGMSRMGHWRYGCT